MSFLASIAFAVLAAGAFLSNSPFGSVALLGCALAALAGACWFCYDALFTLEMASKERKWEDRRAIRPMINAPAMASADEKTPTTPENEH